MVWAPKRQSDPGWEDALLAALQSELGSEREGIFLALTSPQGNDAQVRIRQLDPTQVEVSWKLGAQVEDYGLVEGDLRMRLGFTALSDARPTRDLTQVELNPEGERVVTVFLATLAETQWLRFQRPSQGSDELTQLLERAETLLDRARRKRVRWWQVWRPRK